MNQIPDFTLIRSARRSISIQITPSAQIIVKAPFYVPHTRIKKFVSEKNGWIEKVLARMQKQKAKQYIQGEEFLYLGHAYKLNIGSYKQIYIDSTFNFPDFLLFRVKKEMAGWYIKQAKEIITERVEHHSRVMQTKYTNITFSDTKSKWGSCSPDNSLQFNWRLVMAPYLVIDYVVVHELAHTWHKNHSWQFWRKVELYKPAYRQHKKWLIENSHKLVL